MRIPLRALALTLVLLLVPVALARANPAYDRVAGAYAQAGGQLDACFFTQQQLEAALAGIPPEIKQYVPDLRKAMRTGVALHTSGGCAGRTPGVSTTAATPPPQTTTTTPTTPATTTTPTTPAPVTTTTPAAATTSTGARHHSSTPVVVAGAALGALLLLLLLWWGLARLRGWDPPSLARARHGWGEAGFRTTSTWAEFTDWLRLGR